MALTDRYAPPRARIVRRSRRRRLLGGGTDGNEQLTAITAVILLVLFALLGITIIGIVQLLWLHLFLGVLLVGPVLLKLSSTGYRFVRYYTRDFAYQRKGPPQPLMRLLGPFVVVSTVAVFFTGLLLLLAGPGSSLMLRDLHKLSFFAWFAAVGAHVLGHIQELPDALRAVSRGERRARRRHGAGRQVWPAPDAREHTRVPPGSLGRTVAVLVAMAGGLVLALLFLPQIDAWASAGLFNPRYFHPGG